MKPLLTCLFLCAWAVFAAQAGAQQSQRFDQWELHYSVLPTTFIAPEVAAEYGITRGKRRGLVNIAVREHLEDGTVVNRAVPLRGESWDLTARRVDLDFREIREGPAVYYIAGFRFLEREWRHFEVSFSPRDGAEPYVFRFKRQMYSEQ